MFFEKTRIVSETSGNRSNPPFNTERKISASSPADVKKRSTTTAENKGFLQERNGNGNYALQTQRIKTLNATDVLCYGNNFDCIKGNKLLTAAPLDGAQISLQDDTGGVREQDVDVAVLKTETSECEDQGKDGVSTSEEPQIAPVSPDGFSTPKGSEEFLTSWLASD